MSEEVEMEPPSKKSKLEEGSVSVENEHSFADDVTEMNDREFVVENSKYTDYVTPEELKRLHEFKVLDEVKSNDEDSHDGESDSSDEKSEGVPEEEIERMLDEDLPEDFKSAPKPKEKPYITRQKTVLEEKGVNHFEVLPLDWMMVRHHSGMPVYIHRTSRVCTLSKPYFLGKGNTRRHDIPISAIPCLAYRKALEEEEKQLEIDRKIEQQIRDGTWKNNLKNDKSTSTNTHTSQEQTSQVKTESNVSEQDVETNETAQQPNQCPFNRTPDSNIDTITDLKCQIGKKPIAALNGVLETAVERAKCPFTTYRGDEEPSKQSISKTNDEEKCPSPKCLISGEKTNEELTQSTIPTKDNTNIKDNLSPECPISDNKSNAELPQSNNLTNDNTKEENPLNPNCPLGDDKSKITLSDEEPTQKNSTMDDAEEEIPLSRQPVVLPGGIVMPPPRVETVNTSWKTQHLTHEQVNDYCKKLFKFKTVNIMHFKRWADRRKYTKARKTLQYPTLPEGTKLITIPGGVAHDAAGGKTVKRDWVMNMNGRSYLSVFHEYVCRAMQKQPQYEFKQLENAATPYQATVMIGGMAYGAGRGASKRQAKAAAARASIAVLIPELGDAAPANTDTDLTFFDYVSIEDPRIEEFCAATCEPSPHAILRTCLLRNFGAGDTHIHTEMKKLEYQKIELTMRVGKHSATVVCKNKKTAKQRASQTILQALHPHVRSWGSLLRLYGSRSVKSCKEKKLEEQQITLLQDQARHNEPNHAVLAKLRHEMSKLRQRDAAIAPIGTLLLTGHALPTASGAGLAHVDV